MTLYSKNIINDYVGNNSKSWSLIGGWLPSRFVVDFTHIIEVELEVTGAKPVLGPILHYALISGADSGGGAPGAPPPPQKKKKKKKERELMMKRQS